MVIDPTNYRTQKIHTDIYLNALKPVTLLAGLVNGSPARGARTFNYDGGSSPSFATIASRMTIIFDTIYGEQRTFINTISGTAASGTITFVENNLLLTDNDPFTILHNFELFPQPPSIRSGTFYKFFTDNPSDSIVYSDQNTEPPPICIMGSHRAARIEGTTAISLQITAGADDGYTNTVAGGTFNNSANDIFFGKSGALTLNSFFRRSSVPIPQAANIISATIALTSFATTAGALTVTISGNDEDNAAAPTTYAGYNAKVLTGATVDWNTSETWVAESAYTSPDISTIIQEIIDRPGWASGNALMLFIKDNAGSVLRDVYSYDSTPAKSALLTITYTTPATFSLDASDSYAIASGATIASYLWSCIHNGGGTSGISLSSTTSATPTLTITEADQYWLTCTVTDSNGKTQVGHRAIFTDAPYTDFTLQGFSGDWDSGGWKCTINVTGDMTLADFPDDTLVVLWQRNYFNGVEGYINLWGVSNEVLLCGYARQDSDSDNFDDGTAAASFSITTIEDLLNNLAQLGSVSLGAVASPSKWYEYASWMTVGRSIHHLMYWHVANIMAVVDIYGLTDNSLGVLQTDYTESSVLQQVNNFAFSKGIFAKITCDWLGRIHLVQDAQMLNDADRAALDDLFTITVDDISGQPDVIRDPEGTTTFTELNGFAFNGTTSTPFLSIMGYRESDISYIMPDSRGGNSAQVSNQVLADQTDGNVRCGRYHALQNNNPREARYSAPSNYFGAYDIIPKWFYPWGVPDVALKRETPLFGRRMLCRHVDVTQVFDENQIYTGVLNVSVVLQPEAIGPPGIQGNYPTSYPPASNSQSNPPSYVAPPEHFPATNAYFGGGVSAFTSQVTTDKLVMATSNTAAFASGNLLLARGGPAGLSDTMTYGYWSGGADFQSTTVYDSIEQVPLATGIPVAYSDVLPTQRYHHACLSDGNSHGFFLGGWSASGASPTVLTDMINFTSGAVSASASSNLSAARLLMGSVSDGSIYGYCAGGTNDNSANYQVTADRLAFATGVGAAHSAANLSLARYSPGGISDTVTYGYFMGGFATGGAASAVADRLTFATSVTAANPTSNLLTARTVYASASDGVTYGYVVELNTQTSQRLTFATGVCANNGGSDLSDNRTLLGSFNDGVV